MNGAASSASKTLRLHPLDDVVVAKVNLAAGSAIETEIGPVALRTDIAAGHKIAFRSRGAGDPVYRYGQIIGFSSVAIAPGDHVHTHNLHGGELRQEYQVGRDVRPVTPYPPEAMRSFQGYLRADGRVGTRNYVAIIPTVNCSATVCKFVRDRFRDVSREIPGVDGVIALTHHGGCGVAVNGEEHLLLERVLANYGNHPNVAAYVILALGCEVNQASALIARHGLTDPTQPGRPPPVIGIQQIGGTRKAVEVAIEEVARLLPYARSARRTRQAVSHLLLGTNCGGSDSYSGITSNPALGWAVDELVRYGGGAVLGETTEIYGAEQLLIRRSVSSRVAEKLLQRIEWWRGHLQRAGADVEHNPSPGNIAGGITTVLEKSLGGVAKAGTTPLVDVVEYGERIGAKGFVFMDTPGYDPVSVTGIVAGGANLLAFTTGRGSVFGFKPVPSLKLASNSATYRRMEEDMDLDCGAILEGASIEETGRRIFEELIEIASGKQTKSEAMGIGDEEFDPWRPGPTL